MPGRRHHQVSKSCVERWSASEDKIASALTPSPGCSEADGSSLAVYAELPRRGYTGSMHVEVHLHAELVRLAPDNRGVLTLDVPDGAHVTDLLEQLALDTQGRIIVGVNGEAARLDQELTDGARIDLLTAMAGGSAR